MARSRPSYRFESEGTNLKIKFPGWTVAFTRGFYVTEDPREVELLRAYAEANPGMLKDVSETWACEVCGAEFKTKLARMGHYSSHTAEELTAAGVTSVKKKADSEGAGE
ncbi:MAG: hypothetical protein RQ731_08125 [Anaerosomatales bacterium]|nr:hypothetical protein [Anaerosomatales bacterium]